jgi:uncharacterized protein (TIGR00730 family)
MSAKRICVFCGSNIGSNAIYREAAATAGRTLAERGLGLVYGGGAVGLMGVVADTVIAAGGHVIGVIPRALVEKEVEHRGIQDLREVGTMHERKQEMASLSDAFLAMPGGYGTMDEFCEVLTWSQLGLHRKPCGLLNVAGFFDPLLAFFDHAVAQGFLKPEHRALILDDADPLRLIDRLLKAHVPLVKKWITPAEV